MFVRRRKRYIVLGVNPQHNVDIDSLRYIDIPEGVQRIYLGDGLKWGDVSVAPRAQMRPDPRGPVEDD